MKNVMTRAWAIYKETGCKTRFEFSLCLKMAWEESKTVSFENNMTIEADGYKRTLTRWTNGGHDRVYINGGSRKGDGFVDLKTQKAHLRGELIYQVKIAEAILSMAF